MQIIERKFLNPITPTCHASSFDFYKDKIIFSWFGGTKEGHPDSSIYIKNLSDKLVVLGDKDSIPRWNPVVMTHNGRVCLWSKSGIFCDRWQTFLHDITDWDKWTTRKEKEELKNILPAGLNGPVKNKPIILDDKIICGSSVETMYDWSSYIEEYSLKNKKLKFINRSKPITVDKKRYYHPLSGSLKVSMGIIQPSLFYDGETLHALFRSCYGYETAFYAKLLDGEWTKPRQINLLNPNSSLDCVFHKGYLYVCYNPSSIKRTPLVVAKFLLQNGLLKKIDQIIISDMAESPITDQLSYPFMRLKDDRLHLTYTYGRINIEYCCIDNL